MYAIRSYYVIFTFDPIFKPISVKKFILPIMILMAMVACNCPKEKTPSLCCSKEEKAISKCCETKKESVLRHVVLFEWNDSTSQEKREEFVITSYSIHYTKLYELFIRYLLCIPRNIKHN